MFETSLKGERPLSPIISFVHPVYRYSAVISAAMLRRMSCIKRDGYDAECCAAIAANADQRSGTQSAGQLCHLVVSRLPKHVLRAVRWKLDLPKAMDVLRAESLRLNLIHPKAKDIVAFHTSLLIRSNASEDCGKLG